MAPSFLFSQFMGGLTTAMFLFLIASGLSLVFGVMRVINFAHGSFYMIGAYLAWQGVQWLHPAGAGFWAAALFAACGVGLLGAVVERLFFRSLYGREELYQVVGPAIAFGGWLVLNRTGVGRMIRAAQMDREMLDALGANVGTIYTGMFVFSAFLAGLSGALVTPIQSIVPGMDVLIIVQAFIVVVIGGMGSFWGTFWGSVIYGEVLSFGILIFPGFSLFSVFALMAVILIVRPWGLFGRPL